MRKRADRFLAPLRRPVPSPAVACPSGLRSTPRKRVWVQAHRGFKSHRHRQPMLTTSYVLASCPVRMTSWIGVADEDPVRRHSPEATHHVERVVGGQSTRADRNRSTSGGAIAARLADTCRARGGGAVHLGPQANASDGGDDRHHSRRRASPDERPAGEVLRGRGGKPQQWLEDRFIPPPAVGDRMNHHEGVEGAETRAEAVRASTERSRRSSPARASTRSSSPTGWR